MVSFIRRDAFPQPADACYFTSGLAEVGIYRISGENKLIHDTKDKLDRGGDPATLLTFDVHNVTGLVKMFLRELPEPLIPFNLYSAFIAANGIEDYDDRESRSLRRHPATPRTRSCPSWDSC